MGIFSLFHETSSPRLHGFIWKRGVSPLDELSLGLSLEMARMRYATAWHKARFAAKKASPSSITAPITRSGDSDQDVEQQQVLS